MLIYYTSIFNNKNISNILSQILTISSLKFCQKNHKIIKSKSFFSMEDYQISLSELQLPEFFYDIDTFRQLIELLSSDEQIQFIADQLNETEFLKNEPIAAAELMFKYSTIRPQKAKLIARVSKVLVQDRADFSNHLLNIASGRFLRYLYIEGVYSFSQILPRVQQDQTQRVFFAPELSSA